MHRIMAVFSALALVLSSTQAMATEAGRHRPTNQFSASGPWNTRLPRHVPLAPNSAAIVQNLKLDHDDYFGWNLNTDEYSPPIYEVGRHTPRKRWTFSGCLEMPELAPLISGRQASLPAPCG